MADFDVNFDVNKLLHYADRLDDQITLLDECVGGIENEYESMALEIKSTNSNLSNKLNVLSQTYGKLQGALSSRLYILEEAMRKYVRETQKNQDNFTSDVEVAGEVLTGINSVVDSVNRKDLPSDSGFSNIKPSGENKID